jgi:hypothetical protein
MKRILWIILLVAGLVWAQGPPNPWVRPNCVLGHDAVADGDLQMYRWYVSATPGIVPNGGTGPPYVLQKAAGLTSARCVELGLVAGMTRYVIVTAVDTTGNESLASPELWVIVSVGTVPVHP